MGFDADIVNATGDLANDETSTTLRLATSGDGFAPNGVSFATDLYAPSLRVGKTVAPAGDAQLGDVLTYTVDVTNIGQDASRDTVLSDTIPAGTSYVHGSLHVLTGANAGSKTDDPADDQAEFDAAGNSVVFRLGTGAGAGVGGRLGIDETTSIEFQVLVNDQLPSGFRVVNSAGVGFTSETLGQDGHVNSPDVVTPVRIPDVTIDKSHTGAFQAGRRVPFTLVVSNVGDAPTRGPVTVTDELPAELTFTTQPAGDGWDCSATAGRRLSCVRSDALAPQGAYPAIHFVARVAGDAQPGELENTAEVHASPDGNPTNNTDTVTGPLTRPLVDLAIAKTAITPVAFPGDAVEFLLQVTNLGPDTATRVRVHDVLPPELTPVSLTPSRGSCAGTVCSLGRLRADEGATIDVKAVAGSDTGGRQLRDEARVSAREDETTLDNNVDSAVVEIIPLADIAVTKTTATPTVPAGNDVSFVVVVTNNGPSAATNVHVADLLPAPLQLASAEPLQGTCTGSTCNLGTLAPGASTQIVLIAHSDPSVAGRTLTNVAVAAAREPDRDLANNLARSQVSFTAPPVLPGDVVVTKTADAQQVSVGGELTYRITATNRGAGTPDSVLVTDTPDPGLLVLSVTPSQGTCSAGVPISCQVGPLAPGASATVVLRARATAPGNLRNGVTAIPATTDEGHVAVEEVRSQPPPRVTLRKRATRATVRPGDTVGFVLIATARGRGTARHIVVCDRLPAGLTVVSLGGGHLRRGQPCWTIARLDAGRSRALRLRVRASGAVRRITNVATLTFGDQPQRTARAHVRVLAAPAKFTG
jgi:large repetitive protein